MKTILFRFLPLIISLIFLGCSDDNTVYLGEPYSRCYTVLDSQTGDPVVGARLVFDYAIAGVHTGSSGLTDNSGSVCLTLKKGYTAEGWYLFKEHYQRICKNYSNIPPPEVIYMNYESYLKFNIKNEEPYSNEDIIQVTYMGFDWCGEFTSFEFSGIEVDTTLVRLTRSISPYSPFIPRIDVISVGANPFTDSYEIEVTSRDTTLVNIIY